MKGKYNRNHVLAALVGTVVVITGIIIAGLLLSQGNPPKASPSPVSTAWKGAQGIVRSAATAAGKPEVMQSWMRSKGIESAMITSSYEVTGTWQGHPVVCVKTSSTDLGRYGVSASEKVGPWQCGIIDGGLPDQQANQGFGKLLGY